MYSVDKFKCSREKQLMGEGYLSNIVSGKKKYKTIKNKYKINLQKKMQKYQPTQKTINTPT